MADSGRWGQMLRGELQSGFARFAGTTVHAELHLPGEGLNRQLVGTVAGGKAGPVTGVSLALLSDNRAVLLVALDRFPLPRRVELPVVVVQQSPDPRSITLELQLEPSGWLRLLLPMFAPLARGQGMQLEGNRLRLRLVDFADDTTVSAIASHLDCLEWRTATGVLRVAGRWMVGSPNPSTDRSDLANADQAASLAGFDHKSAGLSGWMTARHGSGLRRACASRVEIRACAATESGSECPQAAAICSALCIRCVRRSE